MPWSGTQFASLHNHKLKGAAASKAAAQANAMLKAGVPEGEAISVANKTGDKKMGLHDHPSSVKSRGKS
jgi:uncharacterized protein YdaT